MKRALVVFIVLLAAACGSKQSGMTTTPPGGTGGRGTLAGTVELVGGTPCIDETKCADRSGFEVVVYELDAKTVAGSAKTTADGKFTLDLPEGKYVILTPKGASPERNRIEVVVSRDALSNIDLHIDNGVR